MQQHLRGFQLALPVNANLRHDQMPAVALHFVVGQLGAHAAQAIFSPTVGHYIRRWRATSNRRDDAHGIAGGDRRRFFLQIPDVIVVHVDIDEAAQLALLVVQVRLEAGVPRRQIGEQLANRCAGRVNGVLLIGVRPERSRDENFRHDSDCPLRNSIDRL